MTELYILPLLALYMGAGVAWERLRGYPWAQGSCGECGLTRNITGVMNRCVAPWENEEITGYIALTHGNTALSCPYFERKEK